jgi:hypothetical protein
MINKKLFRKASKIGFVLSAVLVAALIEWANSANAGGVEITLPAPVVVVAPPVVVVAPPVAVEDDYVYYPSYGIYFNSHLHQYAYLRDGAWVTQPKPYGVSADVLLASPSVHMDFHDSPANHHADMVRKYPKDWKGSGGGGHDDRSARPDGGRQGPGH